jgi:uncharacterized protein (TIGR00369 family)
VSAKHEVDASKPDPFEHVRRDFSRNGFMAFIGATLHVPEAGICEVRVPYRPELTQQHGYFHGAMSGAIADVACGYAAMSVLPAGTSVLAVEYSIHFLEPALGDALIGRAAVIRRGKRLLTCRCDILVERDGAEQLTGAVLETVTAKPPAA